MVAPVDSASPLVARAVAAVALLRVHCRLYRSAIGLEYIDLGAPVLEGVYMGMYSNGMEESVTEYLRGKRSSSTHQGCDCTSQYPLGERALVLMPTNWVAVVVAGLDPPIHTHGWSKQGR